MMLSQGKYNGVLILSRLSVEAITTDQLTPEQKAVSSFVPGFFESYGWGFSISVITRRDDISAIPDPVVMDGTKVWALPWYSDPREDIITILMTQCSFASSNPSNVSFWTEAYQATTNEEALVILLYLAR